MLRLVFEVKGPERVVLISDGVPAAGLPDGAYTVWGETLTLRDGASGTARETSLGAPPRWTSASTASPPPGFPGSRPRCAGGVPHRLLAL